ncbi:hypothetical protein TNCV_2751381 [Trichonephila clavipes]|nr:hypothetical protein TNCV_2751381 [Trichonephila clavipes]
MPCLMLCCIAIGDPSLAIFQQCTYHFHFTTTLKLRGVCTSHLLAFPPTAPNERRSPSGKSLLLVTINSDGTWKTCGHTSLIGVCALIGADCGKVLDMEVMSSYAKDVTPIKGKAWTKYSAFLAKHHFLQKKP